MNFENLKYPNPNQKRTILSPVYLSDKVLFAQWEYMMYEQAKHPETPFLMEQILAYQEEMEKRGQGMEVFIERELKKLI